MSPAASERDLAQRLAEAEATIAALISGQIDAVLDPRSGTPLLLAKAQEALRASEGRYRQIVETTDDGIAVRDAESKMTFVNHRFADMLGYSVDELTGMSLFQIVRESEASRAELRVEHSRNGLSEEVEAVYLRKNGTDLWTDLRTRPIHDSDGKWIGSLCMITDRTRHRQGEATLRARTDDLRQSEARFQELADTIKEVFFLCDLRATQFLYVSRAYEDIFGRSCASLLADHDSWMEAVHPDDRERVRGQIGSDGAPAPFDVEYRIVRPDGSERSIRARGFPVLDLDGRASRYAGIVEDITQRRALEAELRQAVKMEAVGRLASGVAHDFNNLLTVILLFAEILARDAPPSGAQGEPLAEIIQAAKRAARLTAQLLAFSRQQVLRAEAVDVNAVMSDMSSMLSRLVGERIEVVLDLAAILAPALADRGQLEQVLMNLVVNAKDAMPNGGRVVIRTANVELPASSSDGELIRAGSYVMLAISDNGTGMSPETRRRLFEPFFTTKPSGRGTGLGLSTTYGIVKQSNGHVVVRSEIGRGSTFEVYWPRAAATAEPGVADATPAPKEARGAETVLIVEDEPGVRMVARAILARAGYRVLEAPSGEDAERMFTQHPGEIALVITDVIMPGCSGPELFGRLRARAPGLRLLFMSGYSELPPAERAIVDGDVPLVQKPFTSAELLRQVRAALDR